MTKYNGVGAPWRCHGTRIAADVRAPRANPSFYWILHCAIPVFNHIKPIRRRQVTRIWLQQQALRKTGVTMPTLVTGQGATEMSPRLRPRWIRHQSSHLLLYQSKTMPVLILPRIGQSHLQYCCLLLEVAGLHGLGRKMRFYQARANMLTKTKQLSISQQLKRYLMSKLWSKTWRSCIALRTQNKVATRVFFFTPLANCVFRSALWVVYAL